MKRVSLDAKGGQWLADLAYWEQTFAPCNDEQLSRLRQNLHLARQQVLTPRQRQIMELYYDHGLTSGQIALRLGVNPSTVIRTLQRARKRLYRCLRYTL